MSWDEDRYRAILQRYESSRCLAEIWSLAFETEYPVEAKPFGFLTNQELSLITREMCVSKVVRLLDLGCGTGGPGLYVAQQIDAALIGIDIVPEAIELARKKADLSSLQTKPMFLVKSAYDTALPDSSVDAVMSVDCFWMILDKTRALKEVYRVSKTRAKFIFTTWIPSYMDLDQLLSVSGFSVLAIKESSGWRERQLAVYRQIIAHRDRLTIEIGSDATAVLLEEALIAPVALSNSPRRLVIAQKA